MCHLSKELKYAFYLRAFSIWCLFLTDVFFPLVSAVKPAAAPAAAPPGEAVPTKGARSEHRVSSGSRDLASTSVAR